MKKQFPLQSIVVGDYINMLKTTLDFNFDLYQGFKQHEYTKHGKRENLSFLKLKYKSCHHYIARIAYDRILSHPKL